MQKRAPLSVAGVLASLAAGSIGCSSITGSSTYWDRMMRKIKGQPLAEAFRDIDNTTQPDLRRESVVTIGTHPTTRNNPRAHALLAQVAFGTFLFKDNKYHTDDIQVRVAAMTQLRLLNVDLSPQQQALLRGCLDLAPDSSEYREVVNEAKKRSEPPPTPDEFNKSRLWLRVEAAHCLSVFVSDKGAEALVAALRNDPEPEVKLMAAQSLGKCSPVEPAMQQLIGEALIENVGPPGQDRRPFSLKYESLLSLQELTGRGDIQFDQKAWTDHFQLRLAWPHWAFDRAKPFANAGTLPVRVPVRESFLQQVGATMDKLIYYVRKPARTED